MLKKCVLYFFVLVSYSLYGMDNPQELVPLVDLDNSSAVQNRLKQFWEPVVGKVIFLTDRPEDYQPVRIYHIDQATPTGVVDRQQSLMAFLNALKDKRKLSAVSLPFSAKFELFEMEMLINFKLLHLAAGAGDNAAVKLLCENGCSFKDQLSSEPPGCPPHLPIHLSLRHRDTASVLVLLAYAQGQTLINQIGEVLVHPNFFPDNIKGFKRDILLSCLKNGMQDQLSEVPYSNPEGRSLLHLAAEYFRDNEVMAELALRNPRLINQANAKGETPLHTAYQCALFTGGAQCVLLQAGADPEKRDKEGYKPRDYGKFSHWFYNLKQYEQQQRTPGENKEKKD